MKRSYKYEYLCESNGDLKQAVKKLQDLGYKYIVKATDKMFSYWGGAKGRKHIELIAAYDSNELNKILADVKGDKTFNYIDWNYIENYSSIYGWTRGKSYTVRNDWERAFD